MILNMAHWSVSSPKRSNPGGGLCPMSVTTTIRTMSVGKVSHASTTRWIIVSAAPPSHAETMPTTVPRPTPRATAPTATIIDTRAPWITRLSRSRPTLSRPKGWNGTMLGPGMTIVPDSTIIMPSMR